jgi:NitT/TauT family transport system substrate-binding protein
MQTQSNATRNWTQRVSTAQHGASLNAVCNQLRVDSQADEGGSSTVKVFEPNTFALIGLGPRTRDGSLTAMGGTVMTIQKIRNKSHVAIMNAVHDLPVLVARDEGFFKDEDLDIEFVTTPGMAQVTTSHSVKFDSVFDRPLDSVYNDGGIDQYRMCEWGIMKRAVEANSSGLRGRKIVALGASMSKFAIAVASDSNVYEPEMLKDKEIAVTPNNGSHFTTLKMMEGFLAPEHVKTINAGTMSQRIEALRQGKVAAVSLMEPWISVAQKQGLRILIESHSTRSEAASDDLDGRTLAAMFRAQARAVKVLEKDPTPYLHYFIAETGGLLEPDELQTWRLLHAAPQPYTRGRFDDTYNWTVKWNMVVPGATYEKVVDNRAWE